MAPGGSVLCRSCGAPSRAERAPLFYISRPISICTWCRARGACVGVPGVVLVVLALAHIGTWRRSAAHRFGAGYVFHPPRPQRLALAALPLAQVVATLIRILLFRFEFMRHMSFEKIESRDCFRIPRARISSHITHTLLYIPYHKAGRVEITGRESAPGRRGRRLPWLYRYAYARKCLRRLS